MGREGGREGKGPEGMGRGGMSGEERAPDTPPRPPTQHSHVLYGPTEGVSCLVAVDGLLTETKVREDNMALLVEHYILRFKITVDDAFSVEVS